MSSANPILPIGWLLLRDNHAAPLYGLEPELLKCSDRNAVRADGVGLKHTSGLNAIVGMLGFDGDFGDYVLRHWPALQAFLTSRGYTQRQNLCARPTSCVDLFFGPDPGFFDWPGGSPSRRDLADRVFFGPQPKPKRAFTGYRFDFDFYAALRYEVPSSHWPPEDLHYEPGDLEHARLWLCARRTQLQSMHNYLGDQLLDVDRPLEVEWQIYRATPDEIAKLEKTWSVFRWIIDRDDAGWVEVMPYGDRLVILGASDGSWDFLWRDFRVTPPPEEQPEAGIRGIPIAHVPSWLASEAVSARRFYLERGWWEQRVEHLANQLHYEQGGLGWDNYPGNEVRYRYLIHTGVWKPPVAKVLGRVPPGFKRIELASGASLLASDLVTVLDFERMRQASGWTDGTREAEPLEPANADEVFTNPVTLTWLDVCAYCNWMEQELGVEVRPLTVDEHRELRAIEGPHYERLIGGDFPWENFPPRNGLQPAVTWAEPRFLEPGPEVPEFPDDNGVSSSSRRRWISKWPPGARWVDPLPWVEHRGLRFIDAWDAYEWVLTAARGPGIAGRYWHGGFAKSSWGEYKNCKICLRVAIEEGDA
ncbi:hypothetical protein ACNOYE_04970 [Nannocystaceae bacterium ST9]